jgi:DNA-binding LacI/PurR family transcriptional regulator
MESPIIDNPPPSVNRKPNRRDRASEQIKHYIRSHQMKPGELLPPVRALSEHFEVSRDAAWRALKGLVEENWLSVRPNGRYEIGPEIHTHVMSSLKVKALFTGRNYINFTGFRRLADALKQECRYHNMELVIELLPLDTKPKDDLWEGCDVLLLDSDSSRSILKHCPEFKVPVIGMDADYSDRYHFNIVTDHHMGGRMVAERLLQQGSKKACIVHFENPAARIQARMDGFRQVWLESGRGEESLTTHLVPWSHNDFEVALSVNKDLKDFDGKSDLFVTDGHLAVTYIEVLDYQGYEIPENLRLIGYDGAQMGGMTNPPMTTIQQDMDRIAAEAVARLGECSKKHEGNAELVRIPPLIVERISG